MGYQLLYFTHLTALGLWLGSLVAVAWWALAAARAQHDAQRVWGLQRAHQLALWVVNPGAVAVLVAGISMVVVSGQAGQPKPVWFQVMESGGGMVVLISVSCVLWMGRRLKQALAREEQSSDQASTARLYGRTLFGLALCVLGVLLVVSLRLS